MGETFVQNNFTANENIVSISRKCTSPKFYREHFPNSTNATLRH